MNTTLSCSRSEPRCVGIKATVHGDQLKHWTSGVPCIAASCSYTTHPSSSSLVPPPSFLGDAHVGDGRCISTSQDLFHAMEFSDKVDHEFEVLERSSVTYVKAGAREEGEVMGVVDSL